MGICKKLVVVLIVLAGAFHTFAQDGPQKLKLAIAWLHKIEPQLTPDVRAMSLSVEAVLER